MKWKFFALLAGGCLLWAGIATCGRDGSVVQEVRSKHPAGYDYLLYRPQTTSTAPLPLVVYLHGSGEIGRGVSVLKKRNPCHWAKEKAGVFPFILAAPPATREGWNSDKIVRLVERLCRDERIDPDRVYLTGFSMGGGAAFRIAGDRPDLFAAIVPVAGGAHPMNADALRNMPVWAFHGETDETIPLFHSSDMIDAIRESGNTEAKLTVLPDTGHGIAAEVYSRPELYQWMFQHRRK